MIEDPGELRLFKATETYVVKGVGKLFLGRCPFTWNVGKTGLAAWDGRWMIAHPEADPTKTYRVKAVEKHCIPIIPEGQLVGLLVEVHEADGGS